MSNHYVSKVIPSDSSNYNNNDNQREDKAHQQLGQHKDNNEQIDKFRILNHKNGQILPFNQRNNIDTKCNKKHRSQYYSNSSQHNNDMYPFHDKTRNQFIENVSYENQQLRREMSSNKVFNSDTQNQSVKKLKIFKKQYRNHPYQ